MASVEHHLQKSMKYMAFDEMHAFLLGCDKFDVVSPLQRIFSLKGGMNSGIESIPYLASVVNACITQFKPCLIKIYIR